MEQDEAIEQALLTALAETDFDDLAYAAGTGPWLGADDQPLTIERVATLADGGYLTTDHGVAVELSDGSVWTVRIGCHRPPHHTVGSVVGELVEEAR
jgi:hypothetical protein